MATTLQTIVDQARRHLLETTASFWTDAELVAIANRGVRDLHRAIKDTNQDYFLTIDATNVTFEADSTSLNGVPADVTEIRAIEPRVLSDYPSLHFRSRNYTHPDFMRARSESAITASQGGIIWFWATGAGGPVAAPTIYAAPKVNAQVPLRLIYVPTLTELIISDNVPLPGEADMALIAWVVAYALAKESETKQPDAGWLSIYASEKANILTAVTPRATDEDKVVSAFFEDRWD